jgi:Sec-independent protein translocase protein TatA
MKEQPRFSDIQFGPIRHPVLPRDFIRRIKAFKKILGDIDSVPIEQTIDNFKRDGNNPHRVFGAKAAEKRSAPFCFDPI